jgi:predicted RNase H-like nuclease (RuvC/YqgF family)
MSIVPWVFSMTNRTPEQINHNIDQLLAISAETSRISSENTRNIASLQQSIGELTTYMRNRTQQHDLELDDHDIGIERLERDHAEHADRMAKLEDIQDDIRGMMQMLTRRLSGEPPAAD